MPYLFLFGAMLIVMLMRVAAPLGVRLEGQPVGRISLGWKERIRLQRTNVYAIGAVLLLVSVTNGLPLIGVLVVMAGLLGIIAIPTRYVLTSQGVALNRTVFRPWSDFCGFEADTNGIQLLAKPGLRNFRLIMSQPKSREVTRTLQKFIAVVPRVGDDAPRRTRGRGRWPTRSSKHSRTMASAHL